MTRKVTGLPRIFVLAVVALAVIAFACPTATAQVRTGRYRGDINDPATGEAIMRVAMQVPEKLPGEKHLGLILLFHGSRGNENNYIGLTIESLKRTQLLDQYVVISGKSKGPGWTTDDDAPVLHIIQWAKETYPIDPRRVFIFGSSNGAAYVGRFGSAHQELIAGVVGYCGNYRFDPALEKRPAETRNEWYFVHGGKDNPQNSRRAGATLKAAGYRYIFRQMDGYGHTDIWDSIGHPDRSEADAVRADWLTWLHALRHKEIAPTAEESKTLAELPKRLQTAKAGEREALLNEVARIGGEPGGKTLLIALGSADASLRAAAARTTERTIYGPAVIARLVQLLGDESEEVRIAAVRGLARAANWRYPEAQTALSQQARSSRVPEADRLRAVEALDTATRLPMLGNYEDGILLWTPVLLLDDESPRIRAAALAAVEKHGPFTFGYKVDLPPAERRASVEKWKQWCQEKVGATPEVLR